MSKLNVIVPHHLSEQEAITRIKGLMQKLQEDHKDLIKDVKEDWKGNADTFSFTAKGFDISGLIHVEPGKVTIDGKVPLLLTPFKGMVSDMIKKEASKLLA